MFKRNGDCRISAALPSACDTQVKVLSIKEWNELHRTAYDMLYSVLHEDYDPLAEENYVYIERFAEAMRRHIVLPRGVESWLDRRRDARANEEIAGELGEFFKPSID